MALTHISGLFAHYMPNTHAESLKEHGAAAPATAPPCEQKEAVSGPLLRVPLTPGGDLFRIRLGHEGCEGATE